MPEKMDYLLGKGVPAIWFCTGALIERRPGYALKAIEKGFLLGNHSYDHPRFSDLETEDGAVQIRRTDAILERLHGEGGISSYRKYFRFPYGDKGAGHKAALQGLLREMGYCPAPSIDLTCRSYHSPGLGLDVDWYWTYDVMDWSIHSGEPQQGVDSIEKVLARMDEDDPENGKGLTSGDSAEIILLHDHEETSQYFKRIVDSLLAKRLSFQLPEK